MGPTRPRSYGAERAKPTGNTGAARGCADIVRCTGAGPRAAYRVMEAEETVRNNVRVLKDWYERVWNQGDASYIDKYYSSHGKAHGLGPTTVLGPDGFRDFQQAFLSRFPDLKVRVEQCFGQGDMVAVHFVATVTHEGSAIEFRGGGVCRFAGGRIVEAWNLLDLLGLLDQMGVVPEGSFQRVLAGERLELTES